MNARLEIPGELVEAIAAAVAEHLAAREQPEPAQPGNGRLALGKAEAAEAIGVSVDHLERHVLPELRLVRSGRLRLVPVAELEAWIERNAARALEER